MILDDIVVFGAGSIGSTVGGWMTTNFSNVFLIARGKHGAAMKKHGLILYEAGRSNPETIAVNIIDDVKVVPRVKVLVLTVKNYDLKEAAEDISSKLDDEPIIVALQNGTENQHILPKYFSKVIYGIVGYSAVILKPGVVKYQSRGPIYLGTKGNRIEYSIEEICHMFSQSFETGITHRLQDTVHCKIVLNLTNALFTLVGFNYQEVSSYDKLATMASKLVNEGMYIIQKAGYKEYSMKNYPSWRTLRLGLKLPSLIRTRVLRRTLKHAIVNSMGQDVLLRRKKDTELESINGYIIKLADSLGINAPYNLTLYTLCKKEFSRAEFRPLPIERVWESFANIR